VVAAIAARSDVSELSTHTFRHLCLTDLARTGWELHEIARFAGHRSLQSTLTYIHLSGRDLALKLEAGMASIHKWRTQLLLEVLQ
jgi:integrase/recombinase XerD